MVKIELKPLSVNECWQGQRYKTARYKKYESDLLFLLPKFTLPDKPYKVFFEFGVSNPKSDIDNPVKPLLDILQKKYKFDDKDIYEATIVKTKVEKGKEFLAFNIETKSKP